MIKIKEIIESGGACPYQLVANTECGKRIYLRYRNGRLRWGFLTDHEITPNKYEFDKKIGEDLDGFPDDEIFKKVLDSSIEFPHDFLFNYDYYKKE